MARRKRSGKGSVGGYLFWRWPAGLALAASLIMLAVGGVWYVLQPSARKAEVRTLLGNALQREKRIRPWEVAWDLYTLYYADAFVPSSFAGGSASTYAGVPRSEALGRSVRVLRNDGFTVGYCEAWRVPIWVSYRLFDVPAGAVQERPDRFEIDGRTLARVRPEDYSDSGFDRGHLAPSFAIGRCYGVGAQRATFLMSNMVPQEHALNAGLWRELESREALNYAGRFREIWVVTGPLFLGAEQHLDSGVRIPDGFYKIHVDEHEGGIRLQAFIVRQDTAPDERLSVLLTTVDEVERLAGIDFFPDLADGVEAALEAQTPNRAW